MEIVLRERNYAVTERLRGIGRAGLVDRWRCRTGAEVDAVGHRPRPNPEVDERFVTLRGFSWIVEPTPDGVVIAIEIPTGAAVAGPSRWSSGRSTR
jgi:hypothetical protein